MNATQHKTSTCSTECFETTNRDKKKPISDQLMSEEGNINEPEELSTQALE